MILSIIGCGWHLLLTSLTCSCLRHIKRKASALAPVMQHDRHGPRTRKRACPTPPQHHTTPHARSRTRIRMLSRIPMADDVNNLIRSRSATAPPPPPSAPTSRLRIRFRFPSVLCASYFEPKIGTIDHHSSRFSESVTHQFLMGLPSFSGQRKIY